MNKLCPILILPILSTVCTAGITITDPGQGVFNYSGTANGLSGITWHDSTNWYAISDDNDQKHAYRVTISINPSNGKISTASVAEEYTLSAGYDLEGISYSPFRNTFFISDEGEHPDGGYIREHTLPDGVLVKIVPLPSVMRKDRSNLGLESCTWGAATLWTTTEEALNHESALSTDTAGTRVRLQKFDHNLTAVGEWVYETDSYEYNSSLTSAERSGVSDLLVLPDGNLLVLERALGIELIPRFRNRIYLVDFTGATDVSSIADLDNATYTKVNKILLWSKKMDSGNSTQNFEGMGLGPALPNISNNSYSIVLVADNGADGNTQHLYSLVINGVEKPSDLQRWRQDYWGTTNSTSETADNADPDGDSIANLFEYAMNWNPTDSNTNALFTAIWSNRAVLSFTLSTNAVDATVRVEKNDVSLMQPDAWTTNGMSEIRVTNGSIISVKATANAVLTNLFFRLRATTP